MTVCPSCGQTLPPTEPVYGLRLGPVSRAVLARVQRAGANGVRSDVLFDLVYSNDPNGGPLSGVKNLHVLIWNLNRKLTAVKKAIRTVNQYRGRGNRGFYRLEDL